jgi:hypothetical protein
MERMGIGTRLIACPSCSCHAFARETHCPSCGAALRASDGSIQRTAGAVMLGLTLAAGAAACSSETGGGTTGGGAGDGGAGGVQSSSGMAGSTAISAYGVGPGGGFTSGTTGGAGGIGGAGGAGGK